LARDGHPVLGEVNETRGRSRERVEEKTPRGRIKPAKKKKKIEWRDNGFLGGEKKNEIES